MNSPNRYFKIFFVAVMSATLLSGAAIGTTLVRMDLIALAHSAEVIVRARCINSEARWESGSIWTFDDLAVVEIFKGSPLQRLRIRLAGGRVGHLETKVDGVPHFVPGEELVLFVEHNSASDYSITGWEQGTFRVHRDTTGEAQLTQDSSHLAVFDARTRQFATAGIRNISLSEFRERLSAALGAPVPERLEGQR
ncbi:MAG TPA: hypothetical protein VKR82_13075 [Candidatus Acidoferrales bacterium]|nr:hypothetical protein [Candidatus Acidoferrales bacterium]